MKGRNEIYYYIQELFSFVRIQSGRRRLRGGCEKMKTCRLEKSGIKCAWIDAEIISAIAKTLFVDEYEIRDVSALKKGMTNNSYKFRCGEKQFVLRIPGTGTDKLIDRAMEKEVYASLNGLGFCDNVLFFDSETGLKLTEYWEASRVCDANNAGDVEKCMKKLRQVHEANISVDHEFDLFERIDYYEKLRNGKVSTYEDYADTKDNVYELKRYIDAQNKEFVLSHIDAIPDNFLMIGDDIRLIDWEYAGMADPHIDIAMFAVYSFYDRARIDKLIDFYFMRECGIDVRHKIYCYVAACGLLWSNWCEYKRLAGADLGKYSKIQYGYAKDYYKIMEDKVR